MFTIWPLAVGAFDWLRLTMARQFSPQLVLQTFSFKLGLLGKIRFFFLQVMEKGKG
jgi:hypothetical protein